jgi:LysM repeat protein
MNDQFTNKPNQEDEFTRKLHEVAEDTNVDVQFMAELENKLKASHQPKANWSMPAFKKITPVLGWAALVIVFGFALSWSIRNLIPAHQPGANTTPGKFVCPVTQPNGSVPSGENPSPYFLGNGQLWTELGPNGKIYMLPTDQMSDGWFSMKWGFWRGVKGQLTVEGHRLDAEAKPLRVDIPGGYGNTGFQVLSLFFPTTGCWEVTGHVENASLTFVTEVVFGEATPTPDLTTITMTATPLATSVANNIGYDFRGTKLFIGNLPESPAQASVYQSNPDHHVTPEEEHALADRFGIQGDLYTTPGETADSIDYVITDGKQSLNITSNLYFSYSADTVKSRRNFQGWVNPNANTIINDFFKAHGFDFPIRITAPEVFGRYTVERLAPDGLPILYEPLSYPGMLVKLDEQGNVLSFDATLIDFDSTPLGSYGIITSQEALQKLLDDQAPAGKMESSTSTNGTMPKEWYRDYPDNQTITIYGNVSSNPNVDASKPALVLIDGVPAIDNIAGMEKLDNYNFIQATGQYLVENGVRKFKVDAWKTNVESTYISGVLHQDKGQIIITSDDGSSKQYPLIDPPTDLPLSTKPDSMFSVTGVIVNGQIDWTYLQYFENMSHGGGGGGGGLGFYKLNLSGTPVPFPTSTATAQPINIQGSTEYIVQANDTLAAIAAKFGVSVDQLAQANNLPNANIINLGQKLIIPGVPASSDQKIDNLRGFLFIAIRKKADGSQITEYSLSGTDPNNTDFSYPLDGPNLNELNAYNGLPIDISGTAHANAGTTKISVEHYSVPYPDLKFQILKGTQDVLQINGQLATIFTTEDGKSYIELLAATHQVNTTVTGIAGEIIEEEVLMVPGEQLGDYPVIRVFSSAMSTNLKNGSPITLTVTANQIRTYEDQPQTDLPQTPSDISLPPTLNIENVELAYYVSHPHFQVNDPTSKFRATTLQPIWHFHGHYSDGSLFDVFIQALKPEYLIPELVPYLTPG